MKLHRVDPDIKPWPVTCFTQYWLVSVIQVRHESYPLDTSFWYFWRKHKYCLRKFNFKIGTFFWKICIRQILLYEKYKWAFSKFSPGLAKRDINIKIGAYVHHDQNMNLQVLSMIVKCDQEVPCLNKLRGGGIYPPPTPVLIGLI